MTEVHLTPTEFDLLLCLVMNPGVVLTRERLLDEVWGWAEASGTRTVDSHVKALRAKIGADRVRTVHGVGYAFEVGCMTRPSARLSSARSRSSSDCWSRPASASRSSSPASARPAVSRCCSSIPVTIVLALAVTQLLAVGMTSPLREMTHAASRMSTGDHSVRVTATSRDEVGELARAFNRMAADLAEVDRHRRELVANVSHELRTPLAALSAVLENLADGVSEPDPATLRAALAQGERMTALVTDLLDLSGSTPARRRWRTRTSRSWRCSSPPLPRSRSAVARSRTRSTSARPTSW